jgi:hypothetical protein
MEPLGDRILVKPDEEATVSPPLVTDMHLIISYLIFNCKKSPVGDIPQPGTPDFFAFERDFSEFLRTPRLFLVFIRDF